MMDQAVHRQAHCSGGSVPSWTPACAPSWIFGEVFDWSHGSPSLNGDRASASLAREHDSERRKFSEMVMPPRDNLGEISI